MLIFVTRLLGATYLLRLHSSKSSSDLYRSWVSLGVGIRKQVFAESDYAMDSSRHFDYGQRNHLCWWPGFVVIHPWQDDSYKHVRSRGKCCRLCGKRSRACSRLLFWLASLSPRLIRFILVKKTLRQLHNWKQDSGMYARPNNSRWRSSFCANW